jgi:hypothetical protein
MSKIRSFNSSQFKVLTTTATVTAAVIAKFTFVPKTAVIGVDVAVVATAATSPGSMITFEFQNSPKTVNRIDSLSASKSAIINS